MTAKNKTISNDSQKQKFRRKDRGTEIGGNNSMGDGGNFNIDIMAIMASWKNKS